MNRARLERLEMLLRKDAENPEGVKFNMRNWIEVQKSQKEAIKEKTVKVNCNTKACAAGLAALDPEFQKQGLFYTTDYWQPTHGWIGYDPRKKGNLVFEGMDAAAAFWKIPFEVAVLLFDPVFYKTKTGAKAEIEVADRVAFLLDKGVKKFKEKYDPDGDTDGNVPFL